MAEKIMLVDLQDNLVGYAEKLEAHQKRLLHRAFSVFLIRGDEMLIQQRAFDKYHSGGKWANACCSHQRQGADLAEAVQNRLLFELGIPEGTCAPEELFTFTYFSDYGELAEYEYDHVFLAGYEGELNWNPEEMADCRWVKMTDLMEDMQNNPSKYATWFMVAAPKVMEILRTAQREIELL